jgi:hypothetical protein
MKRLFLLVGTPATTSLTVPEPDRPDGSSRPLAEILDDVCANVSDYMSIGEHELVVGTLWTAHTHVYDAFDCSPYLAVLSPEPRCGKSRMLRVLKPVVAEPWYIINPSTAVVYQKIERDYPTMLLDEVDAIWSAGSQDENRQNLRAILDAGNEAGVSVPRCVGTQYELKDFPTYCPKALAGKRALPETVDDRAITIRMQRKAKREKVKRFRRRDALLVADLLHDAFVTWAEGARSSLEEARPEVPDALDNRAQEGWEPLLAIADLAGGDWPHRARAACRLWFRGG